MKANIIHISPYSLKGKIGKSELQVLDVREQYEFDYGGIPAIHIPMAEISSRINKIQHFPAICVVCKTGKRALAVADLLESTGLKSQIFVLDGGLEKYKEEVDDKLSLSL